MAVAFEAKVKNDAILIPDVYKSLFSGETLVMVSVEGKRNAVPGKPPMPYLDTADRKFSESVFNGRGKSGKMPYSMEINMAGFKFSRDEINER